MTQDDVSAPLQRLEVERIHRHGHQSVRGRCGVIAVMYETHSDWALPARRGNGRWTSISHASRSMLHWAGAPNQHRQNQPPVSADRCALELHSGSFPGLTANVSWHPATAACRALAGYASTALQHHSTTVFPNGANFWCKADDGLWWLWGNQRSHIHRRVIFGKFFFR